MTSVHSASPSTLTHSGISAARPAGGHSVTSRFRRNLLSNAGGSVIYTALQLGLLYLLFQWMTTQQYAAWVTLSALIAVGEMASDYGARLWATREFSISSQPKQVLVRSLWCKLFFTSVSALILVVWPSESLTGDLLMIGILVSATQPSTDPLLWYLRGQERLDIEAAVVLVCRTATVLLMTAVAWLDGSIMSLLLIWLGCNVARILYETRLITIQPLVSSLRTTQLGITGDTWKILLLVVPVGTTLFLTSLFQRIGVLLVDHYSTADDVRTFGTAFRLVATSGFLATGMFVSSFAALVRAIAADDHGTVRYVVRRELQLVTAVFFPVCLAGILFSVPIAELLFAEQGTGIGLTMILLMPGLYLSCVNMGFKYIINAFALNWHDVFAVLFGIAVISGVTVFHGILTWPAAAAIAWGVAEGSVLAVRLLLLRVNNRTGGVPLGIIVGSATVLILTIVFFYPDAVSAGIR
jgi:O-antigen/teichoic acid export membrane protein